MLLLISHWGIDRLLCVCPDWHCIRDSEMRSGIDQWQWQWTITISVNFLSLGSWSDLVFLPKLCPFFPRLWLSDFLGFFTEFLLGWCPHLRAQCSTSRSWMAPIPILEGADLQCFGWKEASQAHTVTGCQTRRDIRWWLAGVGWTCQVYHNAKFVEECVFQCQGHEDQFWAMKKLRSYVTCRRKRVQLRRYFGWRSLLILRWQKGCLYPIILTSSTRFSVNSVRRQSRLMILWKQYFCWLRCQRALRYFSYNCQ